MTFIIESHDRQMRSARTLIAVRASASMSDESRVLVAAPFGFFLTAFQANALAGRILANFMFLW